MALGLAGETVVPLGRLGHLLGFDVRRHLGQRQVAPAGNRRHQLPDDPDGVILVTDQVHDGDQHDRDRAGEVEGSRRLRQDLLRVAQVGVDVVQGALRGTGEQRLGVQQHDRVVVHVDHAAAGRHGLRYLVGVVRGRDAGADVEELPDPGLGGQEPHHPGEERAVGSHRGDDAGVGLDHRVAGRAVGGEVVLAAQPIVMHPGAVGHAGVDDAAGATVSVVPAVRLFRAGHQCAFRMKLPPWRIYARRVGPRLSVHPGPFGRNASPGARAAGRRRTCRLSRCRRRPCR